MSVIANIDDSTPTGRKIVKELEKHKKVVKLSNPETDKLPDGCVPLEEEIEEFWKQLESKFGYDIRTIED